MVQVGSPAPEWLMPAVMPDGTFPKNLKLSDYKGKWLVIFFYPIDFTAVCPTEIISFSKNYHKFSELGAEVIGISVDNVASHNAWINSSLGKLNYPLASDFHKSVSREYGILLETTGYALRGTFIIDPNGIIQWQVVHPARIGRSTEETLRVLEALQTGERCPGDWHKGDKTLG